MTGFNLWNIDINLDNCSLGEGLSIFIFRSLNSFNLEL